MRRLLPLAAVPLLAACASTAPELPALSQTFAPGFRAWLSLESPDPDEWQPLALEPRLLPDLPAAVIVDADRPVDGSISIGTASDGRLRRSVEVPRRGEHLYVLESHYAREANFATQELADLLAAVGRAVADEFPGSQLPLADCSLDGGGDIRNHASHEGGRDVDILFFLANRHGEPRRTTGFVGFDESGRNDGRYFDVPRNWAVVRELLTLSNEVQWIFVARELRAMMLEHAIEVGEDADLVARASDVLWQPSDSSPHEDHFHVRLYCSLHDRLEGCVNYGPMWDWASHHSERHGVRVRELLRSVAEDDVDTRLASLDYLLRLDGRGVGAELARMLEEQPSEVQVAILEVIRAFRPVGVGREIVGLAFAADLPVVREAALETAATYPLPEAADMLVSYAAGSEPDRDLVEYRAAARALLDIQDPELVPALVDLLESSDGELRALVASVLTRTTGFVTSVEWRDGSARERARGVSEWRDWYREHQGENRLEWLRIAFEQHGYPMPATLQGSEAVHALAELITEPQPWGYIARAALSELTGENPPPAGWSTRRQRRYWRRVADRM